VDWRRAGGDNRAMLSYYRFHGDLAHPVPAKAVYGAPGAGSGWPEHCPPIRTASAFGWDVLNPFRMRFLRDEKGDWSIEEAVEVHSDVELDGGAAPHPQLNAWFWEKGQTRPHIISDNVYAAIRHQCKVSTFLYLQTAEGWMLWMRDIPRLHRPWRLMEAVIETDWYRPAHPWHGVIELPRIEESPVREVVIEAGEPLLRLVPLQRADYAATEMDGPSFGRYFAAGQQWLGQHGRQPIDGDVDITGVYARQQAPARFAVIRA
jgi:hypothetical protein